MLDCGKLVFSKDGFPFETAILRPVIVQMTDQAALLRQADIFYGIPAEDLERVARLCQELMALCDTRPEFGYRLMRNLAADLAMKLRNTDLLIRQEYLET